MIQMPQVPTAVGRPPVGTGVSTPNAAAAPRIQAPAVNTAPVGRPATPNPGGGVRSGGGMRRMGGVVRAAMTSPAQATPQGVAGAMGGWNAAPDLVSNAVKFLKAGAEMGPQHRAPLGSLLRNTDRPQAGPYQGQAAQAARSFAGAFRAPQVA